jgi:hypothetical protein
MKVLLPVQWPNKSFGSVIWFIGLLLLVNTSNYNRFTNSHTLQFSIAHPKSCTSSMAVATQRLLTTGTPTTLSHNLRLELVCLPHNSTVLTISHNMTDGQSASLGFGSPNTASARTQQRTPPITVPLFLRANCYCAHVPRLLWKNVYRDIS